MKRLYAAHGKSLTLREWETELGVNWKTLWVRINEHGLDWALSKEFTRSAPKRNAALTVDKACRNCGVTFTIPKSRGWREHCCSSGCKTEFRLREQMDAAKGRERACAHCGKTFAPRQWQIDSGAGTLCGAKCRADYLRLKYTLLGKSKSAVQVRGKITRRARIQGRLPDGTRQGLFVKQRGLCAFCRCSIASGHHLDHIFPLSKGGKHEAGNVQLLCKTCNLSKRAIDPIVFAQMHGRLL